MKYPKKREIWLIGFSKWFAYYLKSADVEERHKDVPKDVESLNFNLPKGKHLC